MSVSFFFLLERGWGGWVWLCLDANVDGGWLVSRSSLGVSLPMLEGQVLHVPYVPFDSISPPPSGYR